MEERSRKTLICVLRAIKCKVETSPDDTKAFQKCRRVFLNHYQKEETGFVESLKRRKDLFDFQEGKHIELFRNDLAGCDLSFDEHGLGNILGKLAQDKLLNDFHFKEDIIKGDRYKIILPKDFEKRYREYTFELGKKESLAIQREASEENIVGVPKKNNENNRTTNKFITFITKQGDNFYFNENLIDFGENTQYKALFDIIYSNCLQEDFISYEDINKKLIERDWKDISKNKINKRIQNSITNGIFRFAKIGNKKFKNKLSNGKKILKIIRGKGIEFNNR